MSTRKQATSPIVTACPQCGAGLLNAIVRLSLFGVSLEDGLVVDYDGGPQPESEADIIELCAEDNTIIFCEAGHIIGNVSGAQPDPLQILERIAHWPANSNSDPDVMGAALDEITALAGETLRSLLPKQTLRFKQGHGYNSTQTGDYYVFAGYRNRLYTFYRQFSRNGYRLTEEEAAACFDPNHSKGKADREEVQEASDWHNSDVTI
ncbi:MAG TPA: hypothetical protein VJT71_07955 [Pyrinomonadaceae bacterium]|nr:hypothetical protein [Pyrinomonadaceae bacterium]